jgi:hypothetical protein
VRNISSFIAEVTTAFLTREGEQKQINKFFRMEKTSYAKTLGELLLNYLLALRVGLRIVFSNKKITIYIFYIFQRFAL